jgi:hypothetical protein
MMLVGFWRGRETKSGERMLAALDLAPVIPSVAKDLVLAADPSLRSG